jgi:hypothetical protein
MIRSCLCAGALLLAALPSGPAHAQSPDSSAHAPIHHHDMAGMDMSGMDMSNMDMSGAYGPYPMTREASGTAWQPDAAPHRGLHVMRGEWMLMLHGDADLVGDHQGGTRGGDRFFSDNMLMAMAHRPLGPATIGLRAMLSAEPATIGKAGYPLLLQTGETADGKAPLIDRQHPHDLFMELATSLAVTRGAGSLFVYGGLPGEPALGPPAFMHRFTGAVIPEAPITHHWLDSTHVTFGVLTAGAVWDRAKIEASAFRGREPDENRWNIETPKLDSHSFRLSVNPTDAWALQGSYGRIHSPEQLEPDVNQDRLTFSSMRHGHVGETQWEAMLAWGQNRNQPGHTLDAWLLEASAEFRERDVIFVRGERVQKDELFESPDARAGVPFNVGRIATGYRRSLVRLEHLDAAIGAMGTILLVPRNLQDAYGDSRLSGLVFLRCALR